MLNKKEKEEFRQMKYKLARESDFKHEANQEKELVKIRLEEVKNQLDDFKALVNHLTARKISNKMKGETRQILIGFLDKRFGVYSNG